MNANSFNIISKQTGIPIEQIFQVCSIIAGLQKQSEEGETVQTSALQNTDIPEKKYMGFWEVTFLKSPVKKILSVRIYTSHYMLRESRGN